MDNQFTTYILPIVSGLVLFTMIGAFMTYFVLLYRRMRVKFIQEKEALQRAILETQIEIQEQTLKDVSRELHDNIGQIAALIKLNLNMAMLEPPEKNNEKIAESKKLISELIRDIKEISSAMNNASLERHGILSMIKRDVDRVNRTGTVKVIFNADSNELKLDKNQEIVIYRVCQEMLSNMLQHSQATEAVITLSGDANSFVLEYQDNGIGFEPRDAGLLPSIGGNGLQNIYDRLKLIKCSIRIKSTKGSGVGIRITTN